ncbi:MAG TPA: agmatinase [Trebonia sp.]
MSEQPEEFHAYTGNPDHQADEGYWERPPRLGSSLDGHGAVDDFNDNRTPGPIHVNRQAEGGFAGIQTFAKLPVCLTPEDLVAGEIDVAICGVPWDATAGGRSGTNHGPWAIRKCDYLGGYGFPHAELGTRVDALKILKCADYGDAPMILGNTPETFENIRKFVGTIPDSNEAIPVIMGGDHGITWPCATAVADHYGWGKVGIVHFDAHADAGEGLAGSLGGHGTPMRKLIESGAVPGRNFVQVGLRGYSPDQSLQDWMREHQMRSHFMAEINRYGFAAVLDRAIDEALDQADHLYISLDIDVCDPAYAPGTGTPEPGGLTSIDVLSAMRRLAAEVGIVGMDVVEVSPAYDAAGQITVLLASRAIHEVLTGIAIRRSGITEPDYLHPDALHHGVPHSAAQEHEGATR